MKLGVNIDHIATIRQARKGRRPDPVDAARICERAGADSIVCHLREDRRHIQDADVRNLKRAAHVPLNLEMSMHPSVVATALAVAPQQVTLVPERRQELTTEGGLDVVRQRRSLATLIRRFTQRGIRVSLFVDPSARQLDASRAVGAEIVELHTGAYANARSAAQRAKSLAALRQGAIHAHEMGLVVAAGHGLDYANVEPVLAIAPIIELNIGYAIIVRALEIGLEEAVEEMAQLVHGQVVHAATR